MAFFDTFRTKQREQAQAEKAAAKHVAAPAKQAAKKEKKTKSVKGASLSVKGEKGGGERYAHVLIRPRITEKASYIAHEGKYTFNVASSTTKNEIKKAVKEIYGVAPVAVRLMSFPAKQVFIRGKWGVRGGGKKAIVQLKKGDTIEFV